jgi:hypothetical protein
MASPSPANAGPPPPPTPTATATATRAATATPHLSDPCRRCRRRSRHAVHLPVSFSAANDGRYRRSRSPSHRLSSASIRELLPESVGAKDVRAMSLTLPTTRRRCAPCNPRATWNRSRTAPSTPVRSRLAPGVAGLHIASGFTAATPPTARSSERARTRVRSRSRSSAIRTGDRRHRRVTVDEILTGVGMAWGAELAHVRVTPT